MISKRFFPSRVERWCSKGERPRKGKKEQRVHFLKLPELRGRDHPKENKLEIKESLQFMKEAR